MSYRIGGMKSLKFKLAKPSDNIGFLLLLQSMSATLFGLPDPRTYLKGQGLGLLYVPNNTHRLDVLQNRILVQDGTGIETCLSLSFFFLLFSFFLPPFISFSRSSFLPFESYWTALTGLEFTGRTGCPWIYSIPPALPSGCCVITDVCHFTQLGVDVVLFVFKLMAQDLDWESQG